MNRYIIVIFIIICFIIIGLYINFIPIDTKIKNILTLQKSDYFTVNKNESVVFIGEIPQDYDYWSINLYKNHISINFTCMGNYQTIYPGSTIAVICSSNKYSTLETKKYMEKIHYQKYPNRRIYFKTFDVNFNEKYFIDFRSFNKKEAGFKLYKYIFDNIYYCKNIVKKMENKKHFKSEHQIEIPNEYKKYKEREILIDVENDLKECLLNKSEKINDSEIIVIALDHFMSKSVIYSHILFVDDMNNILKNHCTGVVANNLTKKNFHIIKFNNTDNKNIYILEKLFFAIDTEDKPLSEMIVPMKIFTN